MQGESLKNMLVGTFGDLPERLGLKDAKIDVEHNRLSEGTKAICYSQPEYNRHRIVFDPSQIEDEEEAEEIIIHEMMHVVSGDTENYFSAVNKVIPEDTDLGRVIRELERQTAERLVCSLVRMYRSLTRAN